MIERGRRQHCCRRVVGWAFVAGLAGLVAAWPCMAQVEDPLAAAEELILSGRYTEARAAAEKAERLFEAKGDRHGQALCIYLRAAAELETEDFAAAASDFETSATMLEAAGDRYSAWMALGHLATLERLRRRPTEALARFEQSLAQLRAIESSAEPFPLAGPKRLPRLFGTSSMDPRLLQVRPEVIKDIFLRTSEATTRGGMVATLLDSGRLAEAETELARLAELSRSVGGAVDGEVEIFRGELLRLQGKLNEAREIFLKVIEQPTPTAEREKSSLLRSLVEIEVASGRFDEALLWNEKALALARLKGDAREEADGLVLRAQVLQKENRLEEAKKALGDALALAQKSGSEDRLAWIHKQLGELALTANRIEEAAAQFEAAIRFFQATGDSHEEARTWIHLADLYTQLNSRVSAEAALEKARELSKKSGSPLAQAETGLVEAMERLKAGQGDIAEVKKRILDVLGLPELKDTSRAREGKELFDIIEDFEKTLEEPANRTIAVDGDAAEAEAEDPQNFQVLMNALKFFQQGDLVAARKVLLPALAEAPNREDEDLLTLVGLTYAAELNLLEATNYLARAVASIEQKAEGVQREEFMTGFLGSKEKVFSSLIELLLLQGRSEEAFNYAERARARAFLLGLGNPRIEPRGGADAGLVAEAEALRKKILDLERREVSDAAADPEQLSASLLQAREKFQSLLVRLKVTNPHYSSRTKVEPLQLQAVQAELAPGTTMISYYVTGFQVHAWVLDKESFHHVPLPFRSEDLRHAVCWADEIGHRAGGRGVSLIDPGCQAQTARAEDLYTKLIAPLVPHIRYRRLVLIPHDVLHYLPFAALRDPSTGHFLIEDYTLSYVPSASALRLLREKETPVAGRALVLGAPEGLDPELQALPAAQQEAKAVARLFGTRPLLGREATEGRLHILAGKVDLLHIAAHGEYEPRNSLFSRIILAPGSDHDGNLEVHEISSDLDLAGVNLVVLSACETARGERSGGDEITGLTRAFLYAGSPAVIATLWRIDDKASAVLMKKFYQRLLKGASAAEALREAQLSLRHSPRYSDPFYWAAFSLTGDPQGRWKRPARRQDS